VLRDPELKAADKFRGKPFLEVVVYRMMSKFHWDIILCWI